jgi:hypothetical protein
MINLPAMGEVAHIASYLIYFTAFLEINILVQAPPQRGSAPEGGPGFGLPLEGDILLLNGLNPKLDYRNPKQILNSNAQMLKTIKKVFIS